MRRKMLIATAAAGVVLSSVPAAAQYYRSQLDDVMENVLERDSANWIFESYRYGTTAGSRIVASNRDASIVRTCFSYRSGHGDCVTARLTYQGRVTCVRYDSVSSPCSLHSDFDAKQTKIWADFIIAGIDALSNSN